jgi:hypothetical protein
MESIYSATLTAGMLRRAVETAASAYARHDHERNLKAGRPGCATAATVAEAADAFYRWASHLPAAESVPWDLTRFWFTAAYLAARARPIDGTGCASATG